MADLSITAANVVAAAGATTAQGTAGATITAGQAVYADAADSNKLKLADANASVTTAGGVGIALHGASNGQPLTYITGGDLNPGATVVVGQTYILSATPGGIAPIPDIASGWFLTHLGYGTTASNIKVEVKPRSVAVP